MRSPLILEVGRVYVNARGEHVSLTQRKVKPAGWGKSTVVGYDHYFVDTNGFRYLPDGTALKAKGISGLPSRASRKIESPGLIVKVGAKYEYHWPDRQSIGRYIVTAVDERGYDIIWSNGVPGRIQHGCPLHYDSIPSSSDDGLDYSKQSPWGGSDHFTAHYFIQNEGEEEKQVSLKEYVNAERSAGFYPKSGDGPATGSFIGESSGKTIRGFVRYL